VRGTCFTAAAVLGVLAIWLVVTGTTQKSTTVGALLGFWAVLMAAFPVFGSRQPTARDLAEPLAPARRTGLDGCHAPTEYDTGLQQMLPARDPGRPRPGADQPAHRHRGAAQRAVEKVGGQLRLERIETTRVIGSDIEALQHEVRQLKDGRQFGSFSVGTTTSYVQSSDRAAGSGAGADVGGRGRGRVRARATATVPFGSPRRHRTRAATAGGRTDDRDPAPSSRRSRCWPTVRSGAVRAGAACDEAPERAPR